MRLALLVKSRLRVRMEGVAYKCPHPPQRPALSPPKSNSDLAIDGGGVAAVAAPRRFQKLPERPRRSGEGPKQAEPNRDASRCATSPPLFSNRIRSDFWYRSPFPRRRRRRRPPQCSISRCRASLLLQSRPRRRHAPEASRRRRCAASAGCLPARPPARRSPRRSTARGLGSSLLSAACLVLALASSPPLCVAGTCPRAAPAGQSNRATTQAPWHSTQLPLPFSKIFGDFLLSRISHPLFNWISGLKVELFYHTIKHAVQYHLSSVNIAESYPTAAAAATPCPSDSSGHLTRSAPPISSHFAAKQATELGNS